MSGSRAIALYLFSAVAPAGWTDRPRPAAGGSRPAPLSDPDDAAVGGQRWF